MKCDVALKYEDQFEYEDETHYGNRLIAQFMEAKVLEMYTDHLLFDFIKKENYPDNSRYHASSTLKYHTSLDQLYSVIDRIRKKGYSLYVYIDEKEPCKVSVSLISISLFDTTCIEDTDLKRALWQMIVNFIKNL